MPSPFPGMDPFLEHPEIFPDLHNSFNTYLREALHAALPPPYFARIGRRVWVEAARRPIEPDVHVLRERRASLEMPPRAGGVAVAVRGPVVIRIPHEERHEPFLEIYTRHGEGHRVVTSIETLSPTNKTPGEQGRSLYLRKQEEILASKTHLVEIDLLRGGTHTTAVPRDLIVAAAGEFDYHVCIHHYDNVEDYFVYPVGLKERLPEIAVPLLPGDPAVAVDLQAVFDRSYETGLYQREIRYRETTPVPPLALEQAEWARRLLAAASASE